MKNCNFEHKNSTTKCKRQTVLYSVAQSVQILLYCFLLLYASKCIENKVISTIAITFESTYYMEWLNSWPCNLGKSNITSEMKSGLAGNVKKIVFVVPLKPFKIVRYKLEHLPYFDKAP